MEIWSTENDSVDLVKSTKAPPKKTRSRRFGNFAPPFGAVMVSSALMSRPICLTGVKWSCLQIDKHAVLPSSVVEQAPCSGRPSALQVAQGCLAFFLFKMSITLSWVPRSKENAPLPGTIVRPQAKAYRTVLGQGTTGLKRTLKEAQVFKWFSTYLGGVQGFRWLGYPKIT